MNDIVNPLNDKPLGDYDAGFVTEVRQVRIASRKGMRSGHPGRRAEAARVNAQAPELIRAVYAKAAR